MAHPGCQKARLARSIDDQGKTAGKKQLAKGFKLEQETEPTALVKQLKQLRNVYFAGFAAIVFLAFGGHLGGYWPFLLVFWSILFFGIVVYVLANQIRCPTCNVQLLAKQAIRSPDKCYNCGADLNGPKPSIRDAANDLIDRYGEERAAKTDWQPIQAETATFDTHKLRMDKKGQPIFKQTLGNALFASVFLTIGLIAYTLTYFATYNADWPYRLIVGLPLLFVIAGLYLVYLALTPIRIDQRRGLFILGWSASDHVDLNKIEALQLLPYQVASDSRNYTNIQINLVLKGGKRRTVVTYYNRDKALHDAEQLAGYLGVSLWDGLDR